MIDKANEDAAGEKWGRTPMTFSLLRKWMPFERLAKKIFVRSNCLSKAAPAPRSTCAAGNTIMQKKQFDEALSEVL